MAGTGHIAVVTTVERHEATDLLTTLIQDVGGSVMDFSMFSNHALRLTTEMRVDAAVRMLDQLPHAGMKLCGNHDELRAHLAGVADVHTEWTVFLHVSFIHQEPDLPIPVPSVPG